MIEFSAKTREKELQSSSGQAFDVLVIGGGIIGAGVANTLSQAGISVILVEMGDFASGTSSGSSKLIHGGLRYLAQGRFRLTRNLLKERNYLMRKTDLVKPINFDILIGPGMFGRFEIRIGLMLYRILGGGKHSAYTKNNGIFPDSVKGYYTYKDCITDDALLTVSNIVSAHMNGAVCLNYVKYTGSSVINDENVAKLKDMVSGNYITIRYRVLVNCAGAWIDDVLGHEKIGNFRLSKGIHLIYPREVYRRESAAVVKSKVDGRQMFIIPRGKVVIVGTTDDFVDSPDNWNITESERDYVIKSLSFISAGISREKIIGEYSGIRTLLGSGNNPGKMSRDFSVLRKNNVFTVIGGKVTDYRRVSRKTAILVSKYLKKKRVSGALPRIDYKPDLNDRVSSAIKYECAIFPDDVVKRRSSVYYFDPESTNLVNETALKLLNPISE
jgi:glycerol-3-phosphate dehydrogenase